jgi:alcohol dehydrogenase (cytochrome c)
LYLRAEGFVGNFAALVLAISAAHAAGPTQAELNNAANESANWPYGDHSLAQQAYSALDNSKVFEAAKAGYGHQDEGNVSAWTP